MFKVTKPWTQSFRGLKASEETGSRPSYLLSNTHFHLICENKKKKKKREAPDQNGQMKSDTFLWPMKEDRRRRQTQIPHKRPSSQSVSLNNHSAGTSVNICPTHSRADKHKHGESPRLSAITPTPLVSSRNLARARRPTAGPSPLLLLRPPQLVRRLVAATHDTTCVCSDPVNEQRNR